MKWCLYIAKRGDKVLSGTLKSVQLDFLLKRKKLFLEMDSNWPIIDNEVIVEAVNIDLTLLTTLKRQSNLEIKEKRCVW